MDKLCLIGYPVSHSFSKKIYDMFFKKHEINAKYSLCEIQPDLFSEKVKILLTEKNLKGFNITQPFKKGIIPFLHKLSDEAKFLSSVNCIAKNGDEFVGFNTDEKGFSLSLEEFSHIINGKDALVLGAGGVAPAVINALFHRGIRKVYIANRTLKRAKMLSGRFPHSEALPLDEAENVSAKCSIVVNATTVGLNGERSLIPGSTVIKGQIFYDLIYNPEETDFLKVGRMNGAITVNGLEMLKKQAEENLKIWGYLK